MGWFDAVITRVRKSFFGPKTYIALKGQKVDEVKNEAFGTLIRGEHSFSVLQVLDDSAVVALKTTKREGCPHAFNTFSLTEDQHAAVYVIALADLAGLVTTQNLQMDSFKGVRGHRRPELQELMEKYESVQGPTYVACVLNLPGFYESLKGLNRPQQQEKANELIGTFKDTGRILFAQGVNNGPKTGFFGIFEVRRGAEVNWELQEETFFCSGSHLDFWTTLAICEGLVNKNVEKELVRELKVVQRHVYNSTLLFDKKSVIPYVKKAENDCIGLRRREEFLEKNWIEYAGRRKYLYI